MLGWRWLGLEGMREGEEGRREGRSRCLAVLPVVFHIVLCHNRIVDSVVNNSVHCNSHVITGENLQHYHPFGQVKPGSRASGQIKSNKQIKMQQL